MPIFAHPEDAGSTWGSLKKLWCQRGRSPSHTSTSVRKEKAAFGENYQGEREGSSLLSEVKRWVLKNYSEACKHPLELSGGHVCLVIATEKEMEGQGPQDKELPFCSGQGQGLCSWKARQMPQMKQLSAISKGIMARKATDWAEIRNLGTGGSGRPVRKAGQYRVGLEVSQMGVASTSGQACAERIAVRCSRPKALRKWQGKGGSNCITATCPDTMACCQWQLRQGHRRCAPQPHRPLPGLPEGLSGAGWPGRSGTLDCRPKWGRPHTLMWRPYINCIQIWVFYSQISGTFTLPTRWLSFLQGVIKATELAWGLVRSVNLKG